jgi:MoxR-like ATPase
MQAYQMKPMDETAARRESARFIETFNKLRAEIGKLIVGQEDIVEGVLIAVVCGGHVLLEGVPGLGKTALVTTISRAMSLEFRRIQFTPDLLPADLLGTNILVERGGERVFSFQKGPVFCNILLADEINRATPKTQSALLEAMQEKTVSVANTTHRLPLPYFVLATQNPVEMDGTFPLPEAQLDRFFFKLQVRMPDHKQFAEILKRTGGVHAPEIMPVTDGPAILAMGETVRQVPIDDAVQDWLIRIVKATHPEDGASTPEVKRFVRYGASPRAAQAMLLAARARALLNGRFHVAREDVQAVALPALRHRILLSFEGEAAGASTDDIVSGILKTAK